METKEMVPSLRFSGFEGVWNKKTLGDLGETVSGLTYSPNDISNDGTLVLRSSNVKDERVSLNDNVFVNVRKYNRVKKDDILICVRNGSRNLIGKNCLILKEHEGFAFGAFMTVFRSEMNRFLIHVFKHEDYKKQVHRNLGATINSINNNDLKKFKFLFPSKKEQHKIASFLSSVDEKISQLEKKKTLLETYKRGIMQKIFSLELRFKDENGEEFPDWEEKKLGEVVSKVSTKHKPSDGVMNCIQLEHISQETGKLLGHTYTDKVQSVSTLFTKNHILYSKLRPYLKKYWYAEFNGTCTGEIWVLKAEKINSRFLYFVIQTDQFTETANISSGSKMPRADWNLVSKYRFHAPSLEEQQKIASFLSSIDKKIDITSTQFEKTREFKKGLLQQMFV